MKQHKKQKQKDDGTIHLNERISPDVLEKLKQTSKELKTEEIKKQEEAREKERQRKVEKEKNKSFEDLLNESSLDWTNYK
ncbi:MAG: YqkE family protein [Anaerobacillus sp.]|uniref:YqkE family protein n=1 Tax=Anaerobacillus sp. TaxID=1872506 RepID=UPI00391AF5E1